MEFSSTNSPFSQPMSVPSEIMARAKERRSDDAKNSESSAPSSPKRDGGRHSPRLEGDGKLFQMKNAKSSSTSPRALTPSKHSGQLSTAAPISNTSFASVSSYQNNIDSGSIPDSSGADVSSPKSKSRLSNAAKLMLGSSSSGKNLNLL